MRCHTLLALHAFIGLGEKGGVSLYPKKAPLQYSHFTLKMCKIPCTFPSGCEWKHVLFLHFGMVMFLENELVPMDGCRSEWWLKRQASALLFYF